MCSGCDVCDAQKEGKSLDYTANDGRFAFDFIKKHRRLFTKDDCVNILTKKLNEADRAFFKENVWEARDVQEILSQLMSSKKVRKLGGLWQGHIDIFNRKSFLQVLATKKLINYKTIHRLYCLRQNWRRLGQKVQELQKYFF